MSTNSDRLKTEKAILGELMAPSDSGFSDPSLAFEIATREGITEDHFSTPSHRLLYRIVKRLSEKGRRHDAFVVIEELVDADKLDEAGGVEYVSHVESVGLFNEVDIVELCRLIACTEVKSKAELEYLMFERLTEQRACALSCISMIEQAMDAEENCRCGPDDGGHSCIWAICLSLNLKLVGEIDNQRMRRTELTDDEEKWAEEWWLRQTSPPALSRRLRKLVINMLDSARELEKLAKEGNLFDNAEDSHG